MALSGVPVAAYHYAAMVGGACHRWTVRGVLSGMALLIAASACAAPVAEATYRYHAREHGEPFLCDRPEADEDGDAGCG